MSWLPGRAIIAASRVAALGCDHIRVWHACGVLPAKVPPGLGPCAPFHDSREMVRSSIAGWEPMHLLGLLRKHCHSVKRSLNALRARQRLAKACRNAIVKDEER